MITTKGRFNSLAILFNHFQKKSIMIKLPKEVINIYEDGSIKIITKATNFQSKTKNFKRRN